MKNLKKFGALLLALVMILSLSLTAFAAEGDPTSYTITISNPAVGDTYSAYKIFDVTYAIICENESDNSHTHDDTCYNVSYTIASNSSWLSDVMNYTAVTKTTNADGSVTWGSETASDTTGVVSGKGLTLTKSADGTCYVVTVGTYTETSGSDTVAKNFSAADFAAYLTTKTTSKTADKSSTNAATASDDSVELDVTTSGAGYYLVTCTGANPAHTKTPALAELTTTRPSVTIQDKNDIPFEKTVNDNDGVEIGQTVTYTIKGEVPSTAGYDKYVYKVSDKMSQGLTFDLSSVKIEVGTTEVYPATGSANSDWTVTGIYGYWDTDNNKWVTANASGDPYKANDAYGTDNSGTVILIGFTAEVDFTRTGTVADDGKKANVPGSNLYTVGAPIEITYSATVNDAAVSVISENEATLTFSNDPGTEETTTPVNADVYSAKIAIYKFDSATAKNQENDTTKDPNWRNASGVIEAATTGGTVTYLENAEFVLYKTVTTGEGDSAATTTQYYQAYRAATGSETSEQVISRIDESTTDTIVKVGWTDDKEQATVFVTNTSGEATIPGLEDGTYYLLETKAPDGYNLLDAPVEVVVKATNEDGTINETNLTVNADVANSAGTILPSTGGMGTTIFYIVGGILVLGAAVLLITKRRMNAAK